MFSHTHTHTRTHRGTQIKNLPCLDKCSSKKVEVRNNLSQIVWWFARYIFFLWNIRWYFKDMFKSKSQKKEAFKSYKKKQTLKNTVVSPFTVQNQHPANEQREERRAGWKTLTVSEQTRISVCVCMRGDFQHRRIISEANLSPPLHQTRPHWVEAAVEDASVQERVMAPGCLNQAKKGSWRLRKSSGLHCFSFFLTFMIKNVL